MIVNRSFAKVVSVIFFFEFAALSVGVIMAMVPGFQFSDNPIIRLVGLFACFIVVGFFYAMISEDEETINGEDKGIFLIKGEIEYGGLIPIKIVVGIFLAFVLFIILRSYGMI